MTSWVGREELPWKTPNFYIDMWGRFTLIQRRRLHWYVAIILHCYAIDPRL